MALAFHDLRHALHRVADAAIDAEDALRESGIGERLAGAIAVLMRNAEHAQRVHSELATDRGGQ